MQVAFFSEEIMYGQVATCPNGTDYFFLCLFFLRRFLRLCVAILCLFLFFPLGIDV